MKPHRPLSREAHAHLDGSGSIPEDADERRIIEQLGHAVAQYGRALREPGPEIERRVMAVLTTRPPAPSTLWRWLFSPIPVRIRPATALVTGLAVLAVLIVAVPRIPRLQPRDTVGWSQSVFVEFELRAPSAESVAVAGSFNGWNPVAIPMARGIDSDVWTVTIPLRPGEHEYLFVIDGSEWVPDPHAHAQVDDGFGQSNSVITVGLRGVARS